VAQPFSMTQLLAFRKVTHVPIKSSIPPALSHWARFAGHPIFESRSMGRWTKNALARVFGKTQVGCSTAGPAFFLMARAWPPPAFSFNEPREGFLCRTAALQNNVGGSPALWRWLDHLAGSLAMVWQDFFGCPNGCIRIYRSLPAGATAHPVFCWCFGRYAYVVVVEVLTSREDTRCLAGQTDEAWKPPLRSCWRTLDMPVDLASPGKSSTLC
jgi:hypothetical protein